MCGGAAAFLSSYSDHLLDNDVISKYN